MPRIAFFTLNAYDMLTGGHEGDAVGGAQLQQILIGKELVRRGHEVVFVEYEAEYKSESRVDGINIITKPHPTGSEPSRAVDVILGTFRILKQLDPDVCYRRVLGFEVIPLSIACTFFGCRFVYGVSHDGELTEDPHMFSDGFKDTNAYRWLNRWSLSNADAVVTQNRTQYERAIERLRTDIWQIPNCYKIEPVLPVEWEFESPVVFWAARFQPWKQPELVVELARRLPNVTFVMAGGSNNNNLFIDIKQRSKDIDNIHLVGHVPFEKIDRCFAAADLFLNTSSAEGFPNTFLQAWAQETPVASLQVDPNQILSTEGVGLFAKGNMDALCEDISRIIHDDEKLEEFGKAGKRYLQQNHSVSTITDKYESVFLDN